MNGSLALIIESNTTIDLRPTLPAGTASGGRFTVDASGPALPMGVSLSPVGLLSLAAGAAPGSVRGVVFAYTA